MQRFLLKCLLLLLPVSLKAGPGSAPIEFVENRGQWNGPFLYKAITANADIYLEKNGFTFMLGAHDNSMKIHELKEGRLKSPQTLKFHAYKVIFEGALQSEVTGAKPQQHYYNYFLGNNPDKWKSSIHPNQAVDYKELYKGVDLHIASENSLLKYDLIVQPGTDPSVIRLKYIGLDKLGVRNNNLQITTSIGTGEEMKPFAYQYIDGQRKEVPCRYKTEGNTVSYIFPKGYDASKVLVIDPTLVFATFTGSASDNWGFTATYDNFGNFYAGGGCSGASYPVTTGAFDVSYNGGGTGGGNTGFASDIVISKINATGTAMIYSTYIGGSENDQPHSMIVDASGNLFIAGRTYSNDYPFTTTAFDPTANGNADIVVTGLNPTGTALVGSTYIGGSADDGVNISSIWGTFNTSLKHSYGDDARSEIIVDGAGNVYVAACTKSSNFPLMNASQVSLLGTQDAVVFKLNNSLSSLLWSTYAGGSADDAAYVLALNKSETSVFVSGGTASSNFPTTSGSMTPTYQGGIADGFVLRYQNGGPYNLQRGTFVGRAGYDQSYGIQIDKDNSVFITGQTLGGYMTATTGTYSNPGSSQFIMKIDSNLSSNIFTTVYGSGNSSAVNITPVAFLVDTCGNIYVSGWGGSLAGSGGNTTGMPTFLGSPAPSLITTSSNGEDFYFIVLAKNALSLLFGGYYGSSTLGEHVDGGTSRFDKHGVIYQAICGGCGGSSSPPTSPGVLSNTNNSSNCNFLGIKIAFNFGSVVANPNVSPNKTICLGQSVQFINNSTNASNYEWDFGDGSGVSTATAPAHTYGAVGNYSVRFVAINPNACKERDTAYLTIKVDTNSIKADFTLQQLDSCYPYRASVTNTSKYSKTPASTQFYWNFGDGTPVYNGVTPPQHQYSTSGTYTISLLMVDTTSCNNPDSVKKTISFNGINVDAIFDVSDICEQNDVIVKNGSTQAASFSWDFGNGKTSTEQSPVIKYDSAGSYTIRLIAYNPASCNKTDTLFKTVNVRPAPDANFSHEPIIPVTNMPVNFTNKSIDADSYEWNFGDGTGSTETSPSHFYKRTGTYLACLIAKNKFGCYDTICRSVDADVFPLADIPSGFSPNGDGNNDILYVRGSGIEKMNLIIYNRFGEKIFESNDQSIGWDGKYKGKAQPIEAYAYVLNVTFVDNTTFTKKGNVTLLR